MLEIRLYEDKQLVAALTADGALELGRQAEPREPLHRLVAGPSVPRLAIAPVAEAGIPRVFVRLEPLPDGRLRVRNVSRTHALSLGDTRLEPGATTEAALPAVLTLGARVVRVQRPEPVALQSLDQPTLAPGQSTAFPSGPGSGSAPRDLAGGPEQVVAWMRAVQALLQSAAGSTEFFARAARGLVELVGLGSGRILLFRDGVEHVAAAFPGDGDGWKPSRHVLDAVRRDRKPVWEVPVLAGPEGERLAGVTAVVAAPILSPAGEVLGVAYGDRRATDATPGQQPVSRLDALLVELIASGVAAGLARLGQEQAAAAARVRFEQFFSPELARHLEAEPDLLRGRDTDVTVLFCDIRGFSRVSERLGPAATLDWTGDVLTELSACVRAEDGVLVNYVGDELLAMWGAPADQPDHAVRACRAALAMLGQRAALDARWQAVVGEPTDFGIGLNSGPARVGNVGSRLRFMSGPLGHTVNLGSRVQGATKYLRTRLLATGSTRAELGEAFATRRLCRIQVINIVGPVELFEVTDGVRPGWAGLRDRYEQALAAFERRELRPASRLLGGLLTDFPDDGPSLVLLSRAV